VRLPKFNYFEAKDIKEAVSILQKEPASKILAGGTDLLVNMKHRVETPETIVNLKTIHDLDKITLVDDTLRIGALTRLKRIYQEPVIGEKLPALAQATAAVGSYHHQAMGTLAGNLCQQNRCKFFNQSKWWRSSRPTCYKAGGEICHVLNKEGICYASYCGDVAPALLVLEARVVIEGPRGSREILLEDLYTGDGKTPLKLQPGEMLSEIVIPARAMDGCCSYKKFANRKSIDFPILGASFWASRSDKTYRAAFTAVDRKPVRAHQMEAFLNGKNLTRDNLAAAGDLAAGEAKPVKNSLFLPAFKRRMMGTLFKEAAAQAMRGASL